MTAVKKKIPTKIRRTVGGEVKILTPIGRGTYVDDRGWRWRMEGDDWVARIGGDTTESIDSEAERAAYALERR